MYITIITLLRMHYDVLVIGGGHAGVEAAHAAARLGRATLLVTIDQSKIGALSCNPAVGGVGKGQLVKEVDALGGIMGVCADRACLQFCMLNTSHGAAVRSSRMQVDMDRYPRIVQAELAALPALTILEDEAVELVIEQGAVRGVVAAHTGSIAAATVVIAPGTFFHGLIHVGETHYPGGRLADPASSQLPGHLTQLGFTLGRFKTGTTPRLDGATIDFTKFVMQPGDKVFVPFSVRSPRTPPLPQQKCYIGHTNERTHQIIRDNLGRSALYSGIIKGTGVRYCPSVEDKIVKFPERERHHVFVEPEGLDRTSWYANGLSNSLPLAVQNDLVHSIAGLADARIVQEGYGIEHDYLHPTQLRPTLETKLVRGLFFAGQINGTTGYEEAAAQGLLAGLNAARMARREEPIVIDRTQAYLGVLVDDLVTKGTQEPYRMLTSRVEYRLTIREDNADERLTPLAHRLGLVDAAAAESVARKEAAIHAELQRLQATRVRATPEVTAALSAWGSAMFNGSITLEELLRRAEVGVDQLALIDPAAPGVPADVRQRAEVEIKYRGYIERQQVLVKRSKDLENARIPEGFIYQGLPGLSREMVEKLTAIAPRTLGQAGRIAGVTPAAIGVLMVYLKKAGR
jgi:tRNA uridine 5-carboxymethylaminomethyl modification enzyme